MDDDDVDDADDDDDDDAEDAEDENDERNMTRMRSKRTQVKIMTMMVMILMILVIMLKTTTMLVVFTMKMLVIMKTMHMITVLHYSQHNPCLEFWHGVEGLQVSGCPFLQSQSTRHRCSGCRATVDFHNKNLKEKPRGSNQLITLSKRHLRNEQGHPRPAHRSRRLRGRTLYLERSGAFAFCSCPLKHTHTHTHTLSQK